MSDKKVEFRINVNVIEEVLERHSTGKQINLESPAARKSIAEEIVSAILNAGGMRIDRYWK
jgi:hypothetical protein